jgi:hypothetical protein
MIFTPRKQSIPWLMAAARVTLAPVLVLGETFRWNGPAFRHLRRSSRASLVL